MSRYQEKVQNYFKEHPKASLGEVARRLGCSKSTVAKFKPQELKAKPMTIDEMIELLARHERAQKALDRLGWDVIKNIRNANGFKLYPIEWEDIAAHYWERNKKPPFSSAEEVEEYLKEVFDNLYEWHLYEICPKCNEGIRVPVWCSPRQWTPMCGCSNHPKCNFSMDRGGSPIE